MAKIRIVGDSSGYVEIAAPNAAGNNTLELPSSGTRLVGSDNSGITTFSVAGVGTVSIGIGTTALLVDGNARITGILTVGSSSITLDGSSNQVNVGTGVTIHHTNGVQVGSNTLHSSGLTLNTLNVGTGGTVITTTASGLVGINSTSPAFPLDCDQASSVFAFRSTSGSKEIKIGANDPEVISVGAPLYLTAPSSQDLILRAGGTERLRIGTNGDLTQHSYGSYIRHYTTTTNSSLYRTTVAVSMMGNVAYELRFTGAGNGVVWIKAMASHWTSSYGLVRESYCFMDSYDGLSEANQYSLTSGLQGSWSFSRPASGQTGYQSHLVINKSVGSYAGGMTGVIILESHRPFALYSIT